MTYISYCWKTIVEPVYFILLNPTYNLQVSRTHRDSKSQSTLQLKLQFTLQPNPHPHPSMASRYEIEVKISSATNLKNVNWRHGRNRPYAVVWVDPNTKLSTRVDDSGDTDAVWDETLRIPLPPSPIEDLTLYIDVVHAGSEEDTKPLIGSARLRLRDVLEDAGIGERASRSLTLKRPSGRPQGKVQVSLTIRDIGYRAPDPYYAPPYASASRDYPTAPPAYGYGYPYGAPPPPAAVRDPYYAAPPTGYPYNVAPPSYGYGQAGQPVYEEKKSKFGGMGTGLAVGAVAGALGGLALAEGFEALEDHVAEEAAEKVEDDLGYDDYGGDDF